MDMEMDGSRRGDVPLVEEDKGDNIPKTLNGMSSDAVTSSEVAAESINPNAVSTKQERIQEKLEGECFTDHAKVDNSSVLSGDTAEKQTGMEE